MPEPDEEFDFASMMEAPPPAKAQTAPLEEASSEYLDPITMPQGVDVRPTALSLVPYEELVKRLVEEAAALVVDDEEGRKKATELGLLAKKKRLQVATIKKSPAMLSAELFVKEIRNLCRTLEDPLQHKVEQVCKDKITAYMERQRLERERKEAQAREEARRRQAAMDAEAARLRKEAEDKAKAAAAELEAKAGELEPDEKALLEKTVIEESQAAAQIVAPVAVAAVEEPAHAMRTDQGSSFTKTRWTAEVTDITLVERKYLIVDMRAIQKDVDGGLRDAPGFRIYQKHDTAFR